MLSRFSCVWLFVTPWTGAHQAPLSMGFSRQEYSSGLSCPPPGNLPNPVIRPRHLLHCRRILYHWTTREALQQDSLSLLSIVHAAAKSLQSCPTLCNPIDGSPPGSAIPGILQARTLEWVAISSSSAWKWKWSRSVMSDSSWPHELQPTRFLRP